MRPHLQKSNSHFRDCITVEERLTVTIRYLATGMHFAALQYSYLMGRSTIAMIINESCRAIWTILQPLEMPEPTVEKWKEIAEEFDQKSNFPHCFGAVDGKHIRIMSPEHSGSAFFNYKKYFSLVLMAISDANYCFTVIDVGAYGQESDCNVSRQSTVGRKLYNSELIIPSPSVLADNSDQRIYPYVLVGDEAFALHQNLLRPYPRRNLNENKRIFNYRLTRARRFVESAFGILAKKWRVFHTSILVKPDFAALVIKAACVLHNFVRKRDGYKFEDTLTCSLNDIDVHGTGGQQLRGQHVRVLFTEYFESPEGSLSWQNAMI
ncbi:uncharacterized protein LOC126739422 [Anthonomus grandis grandis]|uniref:uncharacterized protein LOC126739422 n=1 Tax=Anthonomus grandis grandis TaxID=2921223 RepID=UPI0021666533|nr:uncharacterized protein LOC126739422 [Anthonomus grandis grandis]